jgi:hypothetical protein
MTVALIKTDSAYKIEKDVPLPKHNTRGATKYPWRDMEAARRIGGGVKFVFRSIDAKHTRVWRVA